MRNLRTGPQRLGAEPREVERQIVKDIARMSVEISHDKPEERGLKCPQCGSRAYFPDGGCYLCRTCGYSPCK